MPSYVAFLRAVNVGGRFVKMAELRLALEDAGFTDVATHIQSGNVFVRSGRRSCAAVATVELDAWDAAGERCRVLGSEILAELTHGFQNTKLTNTRIERITGRTTTWRDLEVVRAIDQKWGA